MVSSLPYLAPIFIRKAKNYRSKHSDEYNTPSRRGRSGGIKGSHYRLNDLSHEQEGGVITAAPKRNDSEENILSSSGGIVKSLTYDVNVREAPVRSQSSTGISSDDSIGNHEAVVR